ncbi:probable S-adenosylmethionine-dependent methyltransferase At5g37990 isoform X2 [Humulus lupulus]|uniref:probable S-adenosylmethionine-dependent methyltransferase At5g37990 isoform X2 n=1 Tax=Humulus lupulus TaxID=3486 RepID=UPI002B40DA40|nr:probable S-adenosylmethionine-dependent methyltransferase At5g37990 isoform X2 [Humulus lupulus]
MQGRKREREREREMESSDELPQVFPINGGGEDEKNYQSNSSLQKKGVDANNVFIKEGILDKLDVDQLIAASQTTPKAFTIVDMGCPVEIDALAALQNVIDTVKLKIESSAVYEHLSPNLEFQVFINGPTTRDFNTLFRSIPMNKPYYAAGAPGSFYGRLFPISSLHFVYSTYSLHWLSKVPDGVGDERSPAYNKGKIYCMSSPKVVADAYEAQFARDIEAFLKARELEVVPGGLIAFSIVTVPPDSKCITPTFFEILGSVLLDMAAKGITSKEKVNSFNLPIYLATPPQLVGLIKRNENFSIERMEQLCRPRELFYEADFPEKLTIHYRAVMENLFSDHFGTEVVNVMFDQFKNEVTETAVFMDLSHKQGLESFVLLKRKP